MDTRGQHPLYWTHAPRPARKGSLLHRLLTTEITQTTDRVRAENSRFAWGLRPDPGMMPQVYHLRVLGLLRPLGLGLYVKD